MALSPAIQQNMQAMSGNSGDSAQTALEQEFSNLAYAALQQKVPELMPSVVTFRILDTDMDTGHVIGAFVIARKKHILYVPIVLSENKIKPVEIIYSKDLGRMMPLTGKWLAELTKLEEQTLGDAADLPDTVPNDVNLQHMLQPQFSGRNSYAAYDIYNSFIQTQEQEVKVAAAISQTVERLINALPQRAAMGFTQSVLAQPKLAEVYLNLFDGPEGVASYFCRQPKIAAAPPRYAACQIVAAGAPLPYYTQVFGRELAADAYKLALQSGYVIKEVEGREVKTAVLKDNTEEQLTPANTSDGKTVTTQTLIDDLELPMSTGFYRIYTTDGKTHNVFVITTRENHHTRKVIRPDGAQQLIIFGNGNYLYDNDVAGTRLSKAAAEATDVYKYLADTGTVTKGYGVFVRLDRTDKSDVVGPVRISKVYSGKETRAEVGGYEKKTYVIQDRTRGGKIQFPGSDICYLSKQYKFVPLTTNKQIVLLKNEQDIAAAMRKGVFDIADFNIKVGHSRSNDSFSINRRPVSRIQALHYLINGCKLAAYAAEDVLDIAKASPRAVQFAVYSSFDKVASIFGPDPAGAQSMPGEAPPMDGADPMSAGVDPATGLPIDPNSGLPIDPNTGMLIDPNTGMLIDPNTGMPPQGMPPGGDPSMMGGMPPGGDPSMMGGMPPGGDPSMMGGMPPGGDPSQQIDPNTGMPVEGGAQGLVTDDTLDQPEINPGFQGNPELLQDPKLMDMAHLEMLMNSPTLKDIVGNYSGVLLKALDFLGRILLAIYMKSSDLENEIGSIQYQSLEAGVRNLFNSMGETILDLHQNTAVLAQTSSNELADHQSEHTTRAAM